jgi:RHS repeat-associated protein
MQQYIYDYNGNVTADSVRKVTGITYDYRNLPVEMNITPNNEDRYKYKMRYKYDEAGNRIRKQMYRSRLGEENWTLYNDEVYIRDGIGNETAIYENSVLAYFNIWGSGLEGKIKKDDKGSTIYSYYYKDHLGSITAVMNGASGTIIQAQDYDAWGDICRTYSTTDTTVIIFTGKERDTETGYDYFGARYYDSRVSVWLSPDPLFEKHMQWSPYNYVLRNPYVLIDPDGMQINFNNFIKSAGKECVIDIKNQYEKYSGLKLYLRNGYLDYDRNIEPKGGEENFRKYLISAIEKKIQVEYSVNKTSNTFPGSSIISLAADEGFKVHGGLDNETVGPALSLYDEILHTSAGLSIGHDESSFGAPDQITNLVNRLREFLGKGTFGQRMSYLGLGFSDSYNEYYYIPMDEDSFEILKNFYDEPSGIEGATHVDLRLFGSQYLKRTKKL